MLDSTEEIFQVEDECFQAAKQTELSSWKQNNVSTEVLYTGQKLISLKWVSWKCIMYRLYNLLYLKDELMNWADLLHAGIDVYIIIFG